MTALVCCGVGRGGNSASPAEFLERERGLSRHAHGTVWLSTSERRLREHLSGLDEARANLVRLQAQVDERIRRNALLWLNSRQQIDVLQKTLATLKKDDPKRKQMDRQIEGLRKQAVEPKRLGGEPDVRARLIELTNLRSRLTLSLLAIRTLTAELDGEYQRLAQDSEVTAALQQLGSGHRLGPLNTNYRAELQRLVDYERVAFSDGAPLYLQGLSVRVGAILNEHTPIALTWQDTSEPIVLTTGMAEAAGLKIPADAPTVPLSFPQNRRLLTRTASVPSIRFGKYLLHDLTAQVLPPEGEDLGARIGPLAFSQYRVSVDLERLRFGLQPK
ncbi:MAG: hypothetical protein NTY19_52505 [Planctomycetota bacterium]|nr:hypothetical protein [Planctomycetota bacterium]